MKLFRVNASELPSAQFWGLLATLAALFLLGGSSRGDVQSLALLNPIMVLGCAAAFLTITPHHWRRHKGLIICFVVTLLMAAFYILPLSVQIGQFLLGEVGVDQISAGSSLLGPPKFMAVAPSAALQSLFFLFAPMAVLLFSVQLKPAELHRTVPFLIALGAVSGMVGVLQLAGSSSGQLYFYRITNNGSAVGLFANRNHAAVFLACLFPMLAVLGTNRGKTNWGRTKSQFIAFALGTILIPLILVTGSRSGLLAATIGLIGAVLLYISQVPLRGGSKAAKSTVPVIAAAVVLGLVMATVYFSRAEAIERLFADNGVANDRSAFWNSSLQIFWYYFPLGFGPGSFVPAFQQGEPIALLRGEYLNRLHNDWLETALTFGVPGISLMVGAAVYYVVRSFKLWARMDGTRQSVTVGRMASIIIAILAIASLSDYPLRTPAMMGFAILVLLWFVGTYTDPSTTVE